MAELPVESAYTGGQTEKPLLRRIMKRGGNEKGIALVTALLLTLISLAIILAVVYLTTQGTKISALEKRYQTALDASNGGTEVITKDIIPAMIGGTTAISTFITSLPSAYQGMIAKNPALTDACFTKKLTDYTANWGLGCSSTTNDVDTTYDLSLTLSGIAPQPGFKVYTKIVDTVKGNTDTSGLVLEGTGVVESGSGIITPQHYPYIYRIEVQGQRDISNPDERAKLSVLYAY